MTHLVGKLVQGTPKNLVPGREDNHAPPGAAEVCGEQWAEIMAWGW